MIRVIKKSFIGSGFKEKHPEPDAQNEMISAAEIKSPFDLLLKLISQNDQRQNFNYNKKYEE